MQVIRNIKEFDKLLSQRYVNRKFNDLEKYYQVYLKCCNDNIPIKLFGYWGACNKPKADEKDCETARRFIEFINIMRNNLNIEIEVDIILSDMHSFANGYNGEIIYSYLKEISELFTYEKHIKTRYLKEIWERYEIEYRIEKNLIHTEEIWNDLSVSMKLEEQAKKFAFNKRNVIERAQYYYTMRLIESEFLSSYYKDSIFFTFSSDSLKSLYPKQPSIYLWSIRRGTSKAPWLE